MPIFQNQERHFKLLIKMEEDVIAVDILLSIKSYFCFLMYEIRSFVRPRA